ncbi:hypothetical protein FBU59_000812 [Linderina macrospora]|uniref:Uncharacterized protein n=1 Tax=Linderina macrospora TaxID=4868 RepID=A0ACC1JFR1_9FUNG|nr:hypothetical protein FBU59_000812 [Linderina macrospora]
MAYTPTMHEGVGPLSPTSEYYGRGYDRYENSTTPMANSDYHGKTSYVDDPMLGAEKTPARRKRRCCGGGYFCCFSKKCCCIFIPILIVILIGLGVTLYFVWPRIPTVEFTNVTVPSQRDGTTSSSGNAVEQLLDNTNVNRQGVVTVPLVIHLNVSNPNFIPWTIHNVTVDGFLKNTTAGGSNFPVGSGGLKTPFSMPKKSEGNDMPIWFNFRLDTNNTDYISAANIVQKACTAGGPNLNFYYKAKIIIKAISWLGIKPTISDSIKFACPISDIEKLGIKVSDLTGLASSLAT